MDRDPLSHTRFALQPHAGGGVRTHELDRWELLSVPAGTAESPSQLGGVESGFRAVRGPLPVATLDEGCDPVALDSRDHWYRCRFPCPANTSGALSLQLDGLATVADLWLNGEHLLHSDNMFLAHRLELGELLQEHNELLVCFHALASILARRRGRGRWPTRLVAHRGLRFVRTTLLGYAKSLGPEMKLVGPWRGVSLQQQSGPRVAHLRARPDHDGERASLALELLLVGGSAPGAARLVVGDRSVDVPVIATAEGARISGTWSLEGLAPWWPHTHGDPHRHAVRVELSAGEPITIDLGMMGFRHVELEGGDVDGMQLRINGEPIFCRGACWTPLDARTLHVDGESYRHTLERVRDAGMNMLRVGGTMVYESDAFYALCDELGILIWQDFMFANLDYPVDDAAFVASVEREAAQWLERTLGRACVTVLCGGSEVQQQAAMMGTDRGTWDSELFDVRLSALCADAQPAVPYLPSSPCGGTLPFHPDRGPSHYYGVGAFLRPLDDALHSGVRFASECLGLANVPEPEGDTPTALDAPRDPGAEQDFMDYTRHYAELLHGEAARGALTESQVLSCVRATPADLAERVQAAFRANDTACNGALVWWLRDREPGAGWGLLDHRGRPKALYYGLARRWAPRAAFFVDRGLAGLDLHLVNDRPEVFEADLHLELFNRKGRVVERIVRPVAVAPRAAERHAVDRLLGHFVDPNHAYRFGPPSHHLVYARLVAPGLPVEAPALTSAFHFIEATAPAVEPGALEAEMGRCGEQAGVSVALCAERSARRVRLWAPGHVPSDNYFDLAPGRPHHVWLRREQDKRAEPGATLQISAIAGFQVRELPLPR